MSGPSVVILRGDARNLPLPGESVDLICTSPPYFGLRNYGYDGQIGSESTPRAFVESLLEATREMVRVLKPSGSIFVNLGDKYGRDGGLGKTRNLPGAGAGSEGQRPAHRRAPWNRDKSLLLIPERYRIACADELDLVVRAVIVWDKPNGLPESVTDRVRRSHEDWVHLTKSPRYFSAVDEIRETHTMRPQRRPGGRPEDLTPRGDGQPRQSWSTAARDDVGVDGHPLGKLPGSVWTVPTQPLHVPPELDVDHFAAFPMEWPRRIIQGWSPREVCSACGEGQRPIVEAVRPGDGMMWSRAGRGVVDQVPRMHTERTARTFRGYSCGCPDIAAATTAGVVLDPFGGTGTTALVASMHGRVGISVDASADYGRIAQWRCNDPKERARAAGLDPDAVSAIKPEVKGQGSLLDLLGDAS